MGGQNPARLLGCRLRCSCSCTAADRQLQLAASSWFAGQLNGEAIPIHTAMVIDLSPCIGLSNALTFDSKRRSSWSFSLEGQ